MNILENRSLSEHLGILVLGFNRPRHLRAVLESLCLQGRIGDVHVWIDGTQGRGEYLGANSETETCASQFQVKEIRANNSHLGIEKMMLDALADMSATYPRVLVIEDDCFPLEGSVKAFEQDLDAIADRADIYSVYGHHFGCEPEGSRDFSRFQGWGWAAHSRQIRAYLPRLADLFLMDEQTYLSYAASLLTPQVRARLDRTPGRNVLAVLGACYSWDSATALLTAVDGLKHRRTKTPMIVNTGIVSGIGHFREDIPFFRKPPFNMITIDEAWDYFGQATTTGPETE